MNGEDAMVTLLFVDIRDFTPFADRLTAREAVALLNEFFGVVVPEIEAQGGRVQQYLGDGVLAVFGAPETLPDHADRGVEAARAIVAGGSASTSAPWATPSTSPPASSRPRAGPATRCS
jgi:adenylate cyclase